MNCSSCFQGKYFLQSETRCVLDCGDGFYNKNADNSCQSCDPTCLDCYGPSNQNCITCPLAEVRRLDHSCGCPTGQFSENFSIPCANCNPGCKECDGATSSDCIECHGTKNLQVDSTCVEGCFDQSFLFSPGTCLACNQNCKSCNGITDKKCTECYPGKLLAITRGTCVFAPCPSGTYVLSPLVCEDCAPYCKVCSGKLPSQCSECEVDFKIHTDTKLCQSNCLTGYYEATPT